MRADAPTLVHHSSLLAQIDARVIAVVEELTDALYLETCVRLWLISVTMTVVEELTDTLYLETCVRL